jgi:dihydrofolate reductase
MDVGKIIASVFSTLDGVVEAPGSGDVTLKAHRGWSEPYMTPEMGQLIFSQMAASDALLLGRVTYDGFAAFWPNVPDDDPFGQAMNGMTKYVVSNTLQSADWQNSHLVTGEVAAEIGKLKAQHAKNLSITGSGTLIQWLLGQGLLDELQIAVCPVVLGTGKRLFGDGTQKSALKLADSRTFDTGMVMLTYHPA